MSDPAVLTTRFARLLGTRCVLRSIPVVALAASAAWAQDKTAYPDARRDDHGYTLHGVEVKDPYYWLEDLDGAETRKWIEAENKVTFDYLSKIPAREAIRERLTQLWDYEKFGTPVKRGGRYFMTYNDGLKNQDILYTAKTMSEEPRILLDPNSLSKEGIVALGGYDITEDGRYMAYGLNKAGSDWQDWYVRDIETGKDLEDHIEWVKFSSASWTHDGKGFFYSRYDEPKGENALKSVNKFQKLYYHVLGTPQAQDKLIYERPDHDDWGFGGGVTDDGRYLIINVWRGTEQKNLIFYKDLTKDAAPVVELIPEFISEFNFIDNDGATFWFHTDNDAPRGRVIAVDLTQPDRSKWKEIVPEAKETLQSVNMVNNQFIGNYLKDAYTQMRIFDRSGKPLREVKFPGIGTASGFGGRRNEKETFYSYTSFNTPPRIYRYDMEKGESTLHKAPKLAFNPEDFVTKQVFYNSKDGTKVPMFISHKKGLKIDGERPTYLYGYGGFNIPLTPGYKVGYTVWMEMGGVVAIPNLRGGGEYGREWHEAGMKLKKQNVFDDFIAAAEWLTKNGYTKSSRLAIAGGSNGGLLVGACMTQRPDLFGACLPAVGVMDMLRFKEFTIGWAWTSDYGSPDNADEFKALLAYSPYHNLKSGTTYPPTLITTADHDDRVFPAHSFKFAAALQHAHKGPNPVLIRIEVDAGHGAGKPTAKRIQEAADQLAFLTAAMNLKVGMDSGHPAFEN